MTEFAFAFLDCEFGGLDPELHDITEVGLILTDYRLVEVATREWKVRARPERITARRPRCRATTPRSGPPKRCRCARC